MAKQKTVNMLLRVPVDVKSWLEQQAQQAQRSLASQNSEVIRCIRDRMDAAEQRSSAA